MKSILAFSRTLILFAALVLSLAACSKNETDPNVLIRNGIELSGAAEIPPVSTSGTGKLHIWYTKSTRTIDYTVEWAQLSSKIIGIKFYGPATATQWGNEVASISGFSDKTTGSTSGQITIAENVASNLVDGLWYINILTEKHPQGEIRGQVIF